jgi:hypothetical protein
VEDGATKPLYYESPIVKLTVDDAGATAAEAELEQAAAADASDGQVVQAGFPIQSTEPQVIWRLAHGCHLCEGAGHRLVSDTTSSRRRLEEIDGSCEARRRLT